MNRCYPYSPILFWCNLFYVTLKTNSVPLLLQVLANPLKQEKEVRVINSGKEKAKYGCPPRKFKGNY